MPFSRLTTPPMDCKRFRKQHLAYLDDTLSGEQMAMAQLHLLQCDPCAAHDTLVRRSLMIAHSLPSLEPSAEFQSRLRARLAACREECRDERMGMRRERSHGRGAGFLEARSSRLFVAVAATAMLGTFAWETWGGGSAPEIAMQPIIASQPDRPVPASYVTLELMQAMATGNPIWPAALLMEDAPTHFVTTQLTTVSFSQDR